MIDALMDDFFYRALIAGIATAALTGPIGCFIIWRRMSFFGDTLSHSALLGVGLGLVFSIHQTLAVFLIALAISFSLHWLRQKASISSDTSLGILSHGALALGLLLLTFLPPSRIDLSAVFFGDILTSSPRDVGIAVFCLVGGLIVLRLIWHSLLVQTINPEIAKAEGMRTKLVEFTFSLLLTIVIAFSFKIVGVLLISALLVIPAASARQMASNPEMAALLASVIGCLSVAGGLGASLHADLPSGPAIVCSALVIFLASVMGRLLIIRYR